MSSGVCGRDSILGSLPSPAAPSLAAACTGSKLGVLAFLSAGSDGFVSSRTGFGWPGWSSSGSAPQLELADACSETPRCGSTSPVGCHRSAAAHTFCCSSVSTRASARFFHLPEIFSRRRTPQDEHMPCRLCFRSRPVASRRLIAAARISSPRGSRSVNPVILVIAAWRSITDTRWRARALPSGARVAIEQL